MLGMSQDDASDIREFSEELAVSAEVWAKATFSSACFGDKRLRDRLVTLATSLGAKPLDSLPQACDSWGECLGGYRFIANEKTTHGKIMKAIVDATAGCDLLVIGLGPKGRTERTIGKVAGDVIRRVTCATVLISARD